MKVPTRDKTLEKNYIQKWQFWIKEYEEVKARRHPRFRFISDFYKHHKILRQTFFKYYHRYRQHPLGESFLPMRRGPKWRSRRPDLQVEESVRDQRMRGLNKYEICAVLKPMLLDKTPSPSGVYAIIKRQGLNRLKPLQKQEKRKIIKERVGQLGHMDCHYLSKHILINDSKRYYLVAVVDDYTRLSWVEIVYDLKSLSVMFASLKSINMLNHLYKVEFEQVMTDNGAEFCSSNPEGHPFERMLIELGIKHIRTRPFRPQTNGKVERFWRTLNEDLLDETTFDSLDHLQKELQDYLFYYNEHRPHQSLNGLPPLLFSQILSTN